MFNGIILAIILISALVSRLSGLDWIFYVGLGVAGVLGFVHGMKKAP